MSSSALTKKKQKRMAITPKNEMIKKYVWESKKPSPNVVIKPAVMFEKQQRVLNIPNICPFFPISPNFWQARCMYLPWDTQRGPAESPAMNDPEQDMTNLSQPTSVREAKKPDEQLKVQQMPPRSSCILSGFVMSGAQKVEKMKATQLHARVAGPIPGKPASSQI